MGGPRDLQHATGVATHWDGPQLSLTCLDLQLTTQLHIIATLIERTWSSKSAATVWREVTIECDQYKWHLVHKPQMCPANCRHPEMHMHDKGTELDLARRNWASKVGLKEALLF
jgi:hypothetical protein